ncbi:MAG: exo-alpha-sialidase, partial [Armatimonadota bacterium]
APTPVLESGGRIWRGFERVGPGRWGPCFSAFLLSAPVDSDWLDARNWRATNAAPYDGSLLDGRFGGWCEGNAVEGPDGAVHAVLRVHVLDLPEHAAVLRATKDGRELGPPAANGFPVFPGGCKKFTVRRDPRTGHWFALTNVAPKRIPDVPVERTRNVLALVRSTNFANWESRGIVLEHPDVHRHAFQYVDWIFDGDDLLAVSRTAWDDAEGGAHSQHDANHITFHRIARFRSLAERPPSEPQRDRI